MMAESRRDCVQDRCDSIKPGRTQASDVKVKQVMSRSTMVCHDQAGDFKVKHVMSRSSVSYSKQF